MLFIAVMKLAERTKEINQLPNHRILDKAKLKA